MDKYWTIADIELIDDDDVEVTVYILNDFIKTTYVYERSEIASGLIPFVSIDDSCMERVRLSDEIAAVDVGHNPTTERYYLSIIADNQSLIFGKNMPVNDLRWVRGFVIKQIAK